MSNNILRRAAALVCSCVLISASAAAKTTTTKAASKTDSPKIGPQSPAGALGIFASASILAFIASRKRK